MLNNIIGHDKIKQDLLGIIKNPPKVMLFSGLKGVGKKYTSFNFIDEYYSGSISTRLYYHPDILFFEPDTKIFKIEMVQEIRKNVSTTPFELPKKFFILKNIDKMNKESANACLKIFEDCPDNICFILLTENIDLVLNTIKSRSCIFNFIPISNLKNFFPELSEFQLKVINGCPGIIPEVKNIDLENEYLNIKEFILSFKDKTYSEIIEWSRSKKEEGCDFLSKLLSIALSDIFKKDSNDIYIFFLKEVLLFRDKLNFSINLENHFSGMLINVKSEQLKLSRGDQWK